LSALTHHERKIIHLDSPPQMSLLQNIVSNALVGTEREPAVLPQGPDQLGTLLSQLDSNQREATLLGAGGIISLYDRIGRTPTQAEPNTILPCDAEESSYCSARSGDHIRMMLSGQHAEVVEEWLAAAAHARKIVWPELLPGLLQLGHKQAEFREAILPLLGKRGRWLAAQNPDWGFVAGDAEDETIWQTGNRAARTVFLQRTRARNPEHARELLVSTWPQEPAEERFAFIALLLTGLNFADEPFLESALDDRRKEVRVTAARLLALIPNSRLSQRMLARAGTLLKFVPGETGSLLKLKGKKKPVLEVVLPASCDAAMKRDGIGANTIPQGKGEKAGWLVQIISAVRPAYWCENWGTNPVDILAAADKTEWKKELFEGWVYAAVQHGDAVWAEALLGWWGDTQHAQWVEALVGVLPAGRREAFILKAFAEVKKPVFGNVPFLMSLKACTHAWSADFSRAILKELRQACASKKEALDWQLRPLLKDFARFMNPALAKEAESGWPTDVETWESSAETVNQLIALLQFRHGMLEELKK
jgi:hypothetical protein